MESLLTRNKYPCKSTSINVDTFYCNENTYGTLSRHLILLVDTTMEDSETFRFNFDCFCRQYFIPDADIYTVSAERNFAS